MKTMTMLLFTGGLTCLLLGGQTFAGQRAQYELAFSTYFGGSNQELTAAMAVDPAGNIYMVGQTRSSDFPTMNAIDPSYNGERDAFVCKFSPTGIPIYSTYLGGSTWDQAHDIVVDTAGNAYVTGYTEASNFPVLNGYDETIGGPSDAFVMKIDPDGSIVWSTFLGGSGSDRGNGIGIDAEGRVYVTGTTTSWDFPLVCPYDASFDNYVDNFLVVLAADGLSLVYSTYFGSDMVPEGVEDLAVSPGGERIAITGRTEASDFPTVGGTVYAGGDSLDVFVSEFTMKMTTCGYDLTYSTLLGGNGQDWPQELVRDAAGYLYICGATRSTDFPTVNAYNATSNGYFDQFVCKFAPDGSGLVYSTYLGGSSNEGAYSLCVDSEGRITVGGIDYAADYPLVDPIDSVATGTSLDATVTRFSADGSAIEFSTLLGGIGIEYAYGVYTEDGQTTIVGGYTESADFQTVNAWDDTHNGDADVYVAKIVPYVPMCCVTPGDGDHDGDINVSDLTFIVAYLFQGGDGPVCMEEADFDGSCALDVSDLTALVAFLFQGGDPPADCHQCP